MKDKIIISALIFVSIGLVGCNNWLDNARPEDKFDRRDLLKTETGIKSIWNGTYADMASADAYGKKMTLTTIEILAQRYVTSSGGNLNGDLASYNYDDKYVKDEFLSIWKKAYATVLGINLFIQDIDKSTVLGSSEKRDILLGEAYGLRAFVQFDMFRLFGPVYSETTMKNESIPYYLKVESTAQPFLPADSVLKLVLIDLDKSIGLLSKDAVRTKGGDEPLTGEPLADFYSKMRNRRFNYFAAKATKARVLMYMGRDSIQSAAKVAQEVITEASPLFPFHELTTSNTLERKYYSEILFALYNARLQEFNTDLFSASSTNKNRNVIAGTTLLNNFGLGDNADLSQSTDVRRLAWDITPVATTAYTSFTSYSTMKFSPHVSTVSPDRTALNPLQPMIRISEMYYIVAEATGDAAYLNDVRRARLLPADLTEVTDLELKREYFLDMAFEGQLFFFYKRKKYPYIKTGNNGTGTEIMSDTRYVVPLPVSETGKYD